MKKHRDKLARQVIDGKIGVEEARRRLGGKGARKSAVPPVAKMQQARADLAAEARLLAALRYSADPAVREAAEAAWSARATGGDHLLKGYRPQAADAAGPPARAAYWTGKHRALLDQADNSPDPVAREAARQALVNEGMLPGDRDDRVTAKSVRIARWGPGPDGKPGWQVPQAAAPGLQIAPPGTAGR